MTPHQIDYFLKKLIAWRNELSGYTRKSLIKMNEMDSRPIEEMERSAQAVDRDIEIRNQARNWQLIQRIDKALERIDQGTYGYCEETEEPIGFDRLEASPVASYCLYVQERLERNQRKLNARIY